MSLNWVPKKFPSYRLSLGQQKHIRIHLAPLRWLHKLRKKLYKVWVCRIVSLVVRQGHAENTEGATAANSQHPGFVKCRSFCGTDFLVD